MEAKEKAKELVDKFYPRATSYSLDRKNQNDNAKQCALIAVDEIIQTLSVIDYGMQYLAEIDYWEGVKIEIKLL